MLEISEKAKEVLSYLQKQIELGMPPTVREICSALGIKSTSSVHKYLEDLQRAGYITKGEGLNRCLRLTDEYKNTLHPNGVPLLGVVTAGQPILAYEDIEDYLDVTVRGYNASELFALRVRGESMINAGILDGDIIVAAKTAAATNGEIVIAMIDDEATVKRFYKENGGYRLQPENDTMDPIYTDHVSVLGKVVKLVRDYMN